jgi:hypothetical protein
MYQNVSWLRGLETVVVNRYVYSTAHAVHCIFRVFLSSKVERDQGYQAFFMLSMHACIRLHLSCL